MPSPEGVLERAVAVAPPLPGCYIMRGAAGEVLYVGKAKDLKARLRAYLGTDSRPMVPFLVAKVRDVEVVITATEKEALILENSLIKEHRPRYNVDFRDDKAYFHIRVDVQSPFPRLSLFRRPKEDGARYFGPYPSSAAARETVDFLQGVFRLRNCLDRDVRKRTRPCLEFEIGRCAAPCCGFISADDYRRSVEDAISFLEGGGKALMKSIEARMHEAAQEERFEEAALLRDRLQSLRAVREKQRVVSPETLDQDVFGMARKDDATQLCVLKIREGRLVGQDSLPLLNLALPTAEILTAAVQRRYDGIAAVPAEILLPIEVEDAALLGEWLKDKRGARVAIRVPKRGRGRELVELACRNAENVLQTRLLSHDDPETVLTETARCLSLRKLPRRIECFDISNLGGRQAVGARVCFIDAEPRKALYRRYAIRTVAGADDYAMMAEVLKRRFSSDEEPPDLVIIDGGKGHLAAAAAVFADLGIAGPDVVALAKDRHGVGFGAAEGERVYLLGRKEPVSPARYPVVFHMLQRIRDEAHRFAVSYHRRVREKDGLSSRLDTVPGLGKVRRQALLSAFRSVEEIAGASREDLTKVKGIGRKTAALIKEALKDGGRG